MTIPCACGCGQPRRDSSKYASEKCQRNTSRKLYWQRLKGLAPPSELTAARKKMPHRAIVEIHDPLCALPYTVRMSEFQQYRSAYPAGTVAIIGDEKVML